MRAMVNFRDGRVGVYLDLVIQPYVPENWSGGSTIHFSTSKESVVILAEEVRSITYTRDE